MKVLLWIFFNEIRTHNKIAKSKPKFHKFRYRLGFQQNFWKVLPEQFFPEILRNNLDWIWDKTQQILGQTD